MNLKTLLATCLMSGALAMTSAYADHNSPMGAGWANMPNDIHNTRLEDTQEEFMDLVQGGGGADSVNRYDDDTTTTEPPSSQTASQTSTGMSDAATMNQSASRSSVRTSGGAMSRTISRSGRR